MDPRTTYADVSCIPVSSPLPLIPLENRHGVFDIFFIKLDSIGFVIFLKGVINTWIGIEPVSGSRSY